ncbi:hypothetical protein ABMA28_005421 [Loxostege sticticalis]|uniref:Protein sleepless n=1 Tax=Loxostege sticticalis TaxID=481309 RepID=A0ABD0SQC6_LOXSC
MAYFGFGIVVLCAIFDFGSAIMCYECNSATNSFCSEAVLPESLKRNCSEHDRGVRHTLCRKIVQHVDFEVNGQLPAGRVIRSCGWDETKYKGACYHRSGYGGRQEVCSCTKDFCNSSHETRATLAVLLTTTLGLFAKIL